MRDRMPQLPATALTPAQQEAVAAITAGPRGELFGPFVPLLRSPGAMVRLQEVGAHLRFGSILPKAVLEMAVLQVARARNQVFEWGYHCQLALDAGVPREVVEDIAAGREPGPLAEPLATGYAVVAGVLADNDIPDELYDRALDVLGEEGLIDVIVCAGYYTTLAMVMNATRTDAGALSPPVEMSSS
ncbi:hypothetical protein GCM10009827_091810 [Dactylosporangium maewongense]|uniref:Carboxymuconolactone decarboxylase-like domain-containing protein n=1 Tax=Dactylosporangium maewongense TaxID=634393 RepID=A0ABP4N6U5_9ACTN